MRYPLYVLTGAGIAAALLATGCTIRDQICSDGEYTVKAVGNKTGATCVSNNERPPTGYVRYPKGKVPQHVGDKWDKYWATVVVDKDGHIVTS